jgi:hypothetical protein
MNSNPDYGDVDYDTPEDESSYSHRLKCETCQKIIDSDNVTVHMKTCDTQMLKIFRLFDC